MEGKTVVLGASPNPNRYSHVAANMLQGGSFDFIQLGRKAGIVAGQNIITEFPEKLEDVDTFTMYLGSKNQTEFYPLILNSKPRRIIFNPGAENPELAGMAVLKGIEVVEACTLVMIRTGQY
jgi:predicted CoA-binding protein